MHSAMLFTYKSRLWLYCSLHKQLRMKSLSSVYSQLDVLGPLQVKYRILINSSLQLDQTGHIGVVLSRTLRAPGCWHGLISGHSETVLVMEQY